MLIIPLFFDDYSISVLNIFCDICLDKNPPEIEIEIEIDKEYRILQNCINILFFVLLTILLSSQFSEYPNRYFEQVSRYSE